MRELKPSDFTKQIKKLKGEDAITLGKMIGNATLTLPLRDKNTLLITEQLDNKESRRMTNFKGDLEALQSTVNKQAAYIHKLENALEVKLKYHFAKYTP